MNNDFKPNNNSLQKTDEEIDIKKLVNILRRNKSLVVFFTILLFVLSGIYSLSRKKIYEGQFQIVVKENTDKNLEQQIIGRSSLLESLTGSSSNLNTEVGILQSSSVLMPVFEFYKKERLKLYPNSEDISFGGWKYNLEVLLKKNTQIVDISYRDVNKILIDKVLDKTIETYQEYSGKGKRRNLQLANSYLNKQIEFYKDKSSKSIKLVQQFAIDQDLTMLDYGFLNKNNSDLTNFMSGYGPGLGLNNTQNRDVLGENVNIEIARVKAANQIRNIDIKIKKIEALEDTDDIAYINLTIPNIQENNNIINDLNRLDLQIADLKSKYTDKFPEIERLYEKRKIVIKLIKDKSIGLLKAQKVSAESVLEAATRPKGVLLKYKELVREANRDDKTLVELENKLRSIELQQAKLEDPWELITSPTVNNIPVAPNILLITFVGTIIGFVLGFIISVIKEKKTGFIFEEDILESLFKIKILDDIDLNNLNSKSLVKKLFIKDIFIQNKDKSFKFYYSNYLYRLDPKSLRLFFKDKKINASIINDFADAKEEIIIFVTTIPFITFEEVKKIKTQMEVLGKKFYGIVIVKE